MCAIFIVETTKQRRSKGNWGEGGRGTNKVKQEQKNVATREGMTGKSTSTFEMTSQTRKNGQHYLSLLHSARFGVLNAVTTNITILRDLTPCNLAEIYRRFGRT
jgi:hypothetical protein